MNTILLLLLALAEPAEGTVIFNVNGSALVSRKTASDITHVGIVLKHEGTTYVYESVVPVVKKTPWDEWIKTYPQAILPGKRKRMEYLLAEPDRAYTKQELAQMHEYAEKQIRRPWSLIPYVRDKPGPGIHCSQYVTDILAQSGRYKPADPPRTTPADLYEALKTTYHYGPWQRP